MKEFFHYFFGKGETVEFQNFTLAHFLPIIIAAGIIFLIYFYRDKIVNLKWEMKIRYFLAYSLIISELSYFWRLVGVSSELNPNPIDHLPITVCGWAVVFGSFMILTKSQKLFDIVYFWVFAGSIFALITPTVITYTGPTRFRYYQFWVEHLFGYIAIFYLIFVHKMRPRVKSIFRSYAYLLVLAVVAYIANSTLGPGANYLFMARPEDTPSILDILPPNYALRLVIMASVVTFLFFIAYLPWLIIDKKKKKTAEKEETTAKEPITV